MRRVLCGPSSARCALLSRHSNKHMTHVPLKRVCVCVCVWCGGGGGGVCVCVWCGGGGGGGGVCVCLCVWCVVWCLSLIHI